MGIDNNIIRTKIKICGLRRFEDIALANKYKPDYIGFVFAKSKRQVTPREAESLGGNLDKNIKKVGVFVNEPIENIIDLCRNDIIDIIQLHGDEDEDYIINLKNEVDHEIIKVIRVKSRNQIIKEAKTSAENLLLDTFDEKIYGGIGKAFDHKLVPNLNQRVFLAGGLKKDNILKAIEIVQPFAIDISSGVERDGFKNEKMIDEIMELFR